MNANINIDFDTPTQPAFYILNKTKQVLKLKHGRVTSLPVQKFMTDQTKPTDGTYGLVGKLLSN